jgi:hypothetical protein
VAAAQADEEPDRTFVDDHAVGPGRIVEPARRRGEAFERRRPRVVGREHRHVADDGA